MTVFPHCGYTLMTVNEPMPAQYPFDPDSFRSTLAGALEALGFADSASTIEELGRFAQLVIDANRRLNLTRILDTSGMAVRHFADSLSVLLVDIPAGSALVDVGAGGGFPGIPLAIARPDIRMTLMDSTAKKTAFIEEAIDQLGLTNASVLTGRSEDFGRSPSCRESFDYAVWRGLGNLKVSSELCLPLVKTGGAGIALKGPKAGEEIAEARAMIGQLGAKISDIIPVNLPDGLNHSLIVVRKTKPTPENFPRAYSKIKQAASRTILGLV